MKTADTFPIVTTAIVPGLSAKQYLSVHPRSVTRAFNSQICRVEVDRELRLQANSRTPFEFRFDIDGYK